MFLESVIQVLEYIETKEQVLNFQSKSIFIYVNLFFINGIHLQARIHVL